MVTSRIRLQVMFDMRHRIPLNVAPCHQHATKSILCIALLMVYSERLIAISGSLDTDAQTAPRCEGCPGLSLIHASAHDCIASQPSMVPGMVMVASDCPSENRQLRG
jgi:hypothetical protein